jgi:hypothetical protein
MTKPLLICVFGNSGCGKNTFADEFIKEGYKYLHPITDLKNFLEDQCGLERGSLDTPEGKLHKPNFAEGYRKRLLGEPDRTLEKLYKDVHEFLEAHYGIVQPPYSKYRDEQNTIERIFDMFPMILIQHKTEWRYEYDYDTLGDLMINAYHKMKEIDPFFSRPYVRRELETNIDNGDDTIMLAIRNKHEVDVILDLKKRKDFDVEVIEIVRPNREGLSTDEKQKEIQDILVRSLNLPVHLVSNNQDLKSWKKFSKNNALYFKHKCNSDFCPV